jgi:hypothetical protein
MMLHDGGKRRTLKRPAGNGGKMMSDSTSLSPVRHMCFCEESSLWTLLTSTPALSVLSSWPPNFEIESHCSCGVRHDGSALVLKAIRCRCKTKRAPENRINTQTLSRRCMGKHLVDRKHVSVRPGASATARQSPSFLPSEEMLISSKFRV